MKKPEKGVVLGKAMRLARERAGLTQEQLAQAVGLTVSSVSRIEAGQTTDPKFSTVAAVAAATGLTVGELLDLPKKKNEK